MVPTENIGNELFAGQLPSIEDIKVMAGDINSSEYDRSEFLKLFEENKGNDLAIGIGYCIIAQHALAIEHLTKAKASKEQQVFLGDSYLGLLDFDKAIAACDQAIGACSMSGVSQSNPLRANTRAAVGPAVGRDLTASNRPGLTAMSWSGVLSGIRDSRSYGVAFTRGLNGMSSL